MGGKTQNVSCKRSCLLGIHTCIEKIVAASIKKYFLHMYKKIDSTLFELQTILVFSLLKYLVCTHFDTYIDW